MATISGEVRDENNELLADCVVRAYRRDTGALLVAGVSGDGSTPVVGDDYWADTVLRLPFDADFVDVSAQTETASVQNSPSIATSDQKYGDGCLDITSGTADHLIYTAVDALGTGDYTVEFWVNVHSGAINCVLCAWGTCISDASSTAGMVLMINGISGGYGGFSLYNGNTLRLPSNVNPTIGAWTHFAIVRASGTTKLFINGTSQGPPYADTYNCAAGFSIGGPSGIFGQVDALFDDVRITKGVARYSANFTPPTAALPTFGTITALPVGEYELTTTYTGEVQVIALDPAGGTTFNDLILRTTPV